jgi:hypothetical protein
MSNITSGFTAHKKSTSDYVMDNIFILNVVLNHIQLEMYL